MRYMYKRNGGLDIKAALSDSPVVFINGARQVGKSTLAKSLMAEGALYLTFDEATTRAAAISSPPDFLEALPSTVVIDEVQRVPEIFLAMKKMVDEDRKPGKFLLTGSASVLTLPRLADSLAGRMEIHTLWPLSQGEIAGRQEGFIDACFGDRKLPPVPSIVWEEIVKRVCAGGYPEALRRKDSKRLRAWYGSYITAIIEKDIKELSDIEGKKDIPDILRIMAARAGGLLNVSELSRVSKVKNTTLKRYIALLESVFIYVPLEAWFRNLEKRVVKAPKIYLNDTGLLAYLQGISGDRLASDRNAAGPFMENFAVMELRKQGGWSDTAPLFYHFRTSAGQEVDIVMEARDGRVVGVEIKSRGAVGSEDFSGLKALREAAGDKFHRGVVLYTGRETVSFGNKLEAAPISSLWEV